MFVWLFLARYVVGHNLASTGTVAANILLLKTRGILIWPIFCISLLLNRLRQEGKKFWENTIYLETVYIPADEVLCTVNEHVKSRFVIRTDALLPEALEIVEGKLLVS